MRDFSIVPNSIIGPDSGLSAMDVVMFILLDLHTNDDGDGLCFPGQELLADLSGATERTVRRSIRNLEHAGWITVEHRRGGGNRYRIPYRANRKSTSDSKPEIGNPCPVIPGGNGTCMSGQIGHVSPIKSDTGVRLRRANETKLIKDKSSSPKFHFDEADMETAKWMFSLNRQLLPDSKEPNFESWANHIRLMRESDHRTPEAIRELYEFAHKDPFWKSNVRCPEKLREKWETLAIQKGNPKNGNGKPTYTPGPGQVYDPSAPPCVF